MKWFMLALTLAACSKHPSFGTVISKEIVPAHVYQHTDLIPAGKGVLVPITRMRFAATAYYICTVWQDEGPDCGEISSFAFNALRVGDYYGGVR